ncbi:MAG: gamma-glutamyltransferase, partial [Gammaproteobacteria bacterium]|nr:gamma-glutamyltransferase [Gammaproteobacteria bacterium]
MKRFRLDLTWCADIGLYRRAMGKNLGVIAAGHSATAEAAEHMLRAGGNAYDAVLAGMCAACAAEPVLASPGGGGFLLARPADGPPRLYDFFTHTPAKRRPESELDFYAIMADFGAAQQEFHIGRGTVAVPGVIRGLFDAHRDLCRMPMAEIVAPATTYAREGVELTPFQAYLFQVIKPTFMATKEVSAIFGSKVRDDDLVGAGEVLKQPELADALETLAIEGEDLFYLGEISAAIDNDMREGGQLTREDLAAYSVERRAPLSLDYAGTRVLTNPPPSSGGILIAFGLKLAEPLEIRATEFGSTEYVRVLARVMEATARARVEACARSTTGVLEEALMLDTALIQSYRNEVAGRLRADRGTTQISVIDAAGNVATLTVSNGEGSGYVVPGTGIVLNNMLGEEDLNLDGFHRWPTAHRMTSMMAPTILLERGGRTVATGSGGSNRIRTAILQVLLNLIELSMGLEDAVISPRLHYENELLSLEGGFDRDRLKDVLEEFPQHHVWTELNMFFGGAHSCMREGSSMIGVG